ncbi:MAG: hypothetical protein NVSMB2_21740 [Chloroflexota bacterium]
MAISTPTRPSSPSAPGPESTSSLPRAWRVRAGLTLVAVALLIAIVGGVYVAGSRISEPTQPAAAAPAAVVPTPAPLTAGQLMQVLQRSVVAPNATNLEITYAPPVFFEATGRQAPSDGKSLVFYLQEDTHIDALDTMPTRFTVSIDGQGQYAPTSGNILSDSGHHRQSMFEFAQPDLPTPRESLAATFYFAAGGEATTTWQMPIALPNGTSVGAAPPASVASAGAPDDVMTSAQLAALNATLRRTQSNVTFGGHTVAEVGITFATAEYFAAALPPEAATRFTPDQAAVFLVSETNHGADLPSEPVPLVLTYQGVTLTPDYVEPTVTSAHHRVTLMRFGVNPFASKLLGRVDVQLPDGTVLKWGLPVVYERSQAASPLGFSFASILSLVGGMLAAMWPCLFQLTVFFIPALAGVSMEEANRGGGSAARRWRVLKAALFFVLGFTLVYTLAGATVGFAVQQFGNAPNFDVAQRYVGVVAGLAIIVLALRTAAKVRAPVVCKMPVLSRMAHGRRASSPVELMVAGLAFATGCMTCFGAALIIAMVVYVGMAGSALVGALTLFLFSMGMGVPLVIAATAMGRVLPLLSRLERVTPWMGLASSLVMIAFAVMLMTGNYMAFTAWIMERL